MYEKILRITSIFIHIILFKLSASIIYIHLIFYKCNHHIMCCTLHTLDSICPSKSKFFVFFLNWQSVLSVLVSFFYLDQRYGPKYLTHRAEAGYVASIFSSNIIIINNNNNNYSNNNFIYNFALVQKPSKSKNN